MWLSSVSSNTRPDPVLLYSCKHITHVRCRSWGRTPWSYVLHDVSIFWKEKQNGNNEVNPKPHYRGTFISLSGPHVNITQDQLKRWHASLVYLDLHLIVKTFFVCSVLSYTQRAKPLHGQTEAFNTSSIPPRSATSFRSAEKYFERDAMTPTGTSTVVFKSKFRPSSWIYASVLRGN